MGRPSGFEVAFLAFMRFCATFSVCLMGFHVTMQVRKVGVNDLESLIGDVLAPFPELQQRKDALISAQGGHLWCGQVTVLGRAAHARQTR